MGNLYSASKIAKMIGITSATLTNWERAGLIPKAARIGRTMKKMNVQCDATNRVDRPAFGDAVFDLVRRTACELPADVEQALRRAHSEEAPN